MAKVDMNPVRAPATAGAGVAAAGRETTVGVTPNDKQFNRLRIELELPPDQISRIKAAVGQLPKLDLSADQMKALATAGKDKKTVEAAWAKAMQLLDGKSPGWAGSKIDLRRSTEPRERMLFSEAENMHAGIDDMHKRSPEAQLKNLEGTLNQHPYGDIDAAYALGDYHPTPDVMATHVIDTYKLRLMTAAILAGVDASSLGLSRTQ